MSTGSILLLKMWPWTALTVACHCYCYLCNSDFWIIWVIGLVMPATPCKVEMSFSASLAVFSPCGFRQLGFLLFWGLLLNKVDSFSVFGTDTLASYDSALSDMVKISSATTKIVGFCSLRGSLTNSSSGWLNVIHWVLYSLIDYRILPIFLKWSPCEAATVFCTYKNAHAYFSSLPYSLSSFL